MYQRHPSAELNALFVRKPYQGVRPHDALFLFVGLDANYEADIADMPIFARVLEYHNDAVGFWRRWGVHHPFLLPKYSGGGRRYHRNFARIGFKPTHADKVSFAELLQVPTVGRSVLTRNDLDDAHLGWLNEAILGGRAQHVFVSDRVRRLMLASKKFSWLGGKRADSSDALPVLYRASNKAVYSHLHFSVYGKFEARKAAEAEAIGALLEGCRPP